LVGSHDGLESPVAISWESAWANPLKIGSTFISGK